MTKLLVFAGSTRQLSFNRRLANAAAAMARAEGADVTHIELSDFDVPLYNADLEARGTPSTLAELNDHDCLQFVLPSTGRAMPWIFRDTAGKDIDFTFRSQKRVHDDVLGCVNWAIAGGGLFQIYHFIAQAAVSRGELVEVLHSAGGRTRRFSILYPQNRHLSARVRAFVDFMVRAVRNT